MNSVTTEVFEGQSQLVTERGQLRPLLRDQINWVRMLLGMALFFFFSFQLMHRQTYSGTPQLAGFELSRASVPSVLARAPGTMIVDSAGLVASFLFAVGYGSGICGFVLLVFHCFFNEGNIQFGWEPLVDPLLVIVIFSGFKTVSRHHLNVAMKVVACLVCARVGWSQIEAAPWLESTSVMRYLMHSPFTAIFGRWAGLAPLIEIIGGFAWLLQVIGPSIFLLSFWPRCPRGLTPSFALAFFITHLVLAIFMPLAFWNVAAIAVAVPFLPAGWLSTDRKLWIAELPLLKASGRLIGFVLLTATMLCTIFDRNIAEQFDIFSKIGSFTVLRTYDIATNSFVKAGNLILFNSIWKMYSPTWRHVVWIEWYAKNQDGSVTALEQENFSPEYRMKRRTWSEAVWTDFKKEKVFVGMLSRQEDRATYGKYLCHEMGKTGRMPVSVHAEINSFNIRGLEETWSLKDQKVEENRKDPETVCDQ